MRTLIGSAAGVMAVGLYTLSWLLDNVAVMLTG